MRCCSFCLPSSLTESMQALEVIFRPLVFTFWTMFTCNLHNVMYFWTIFCIAFRLKCKRITTSASTCHKCLSARLPLMWTATSSSNAVIPASWIKGVYWNNVCSADFDFSYFLSSLWALMYLIGDERTVTRAVLLTVFVRFWYSVLKQIFGWSHIGNVAGFKPSH